MGRELSRGRVFDLVNPSKRSFRNATETDAGADGRRCRRTPTPAAGLTDRVWTSDEWLRYPALKSAFNITHGFDINII